MSQKLLSKLADYDVVLIGVFSDKGWSREAFAAVASKSRSAVGVFFMNPYKMGHFGNRLTQLGALVLAGDDTPATREAAAEGVFGGCAMTGRMPVAIPGIARLGEGVSTRKVRLGFTQPPAEFFTDDLQQRIDGVMNEAVASGAIPGGQVAVIRNGNVVVNSNYGVIDRGGHAAVTDSTIYDLASVT